MMLLGLRGVGKTVLLIRISENAEDRGFLTVFIEAPEERSLAALLVPRLRGLLYRLSRFQQARILSNRALGALRSFASVFKVSYGEFEVGIDPEPGLSASGDLESDLAELLVSIAEAARAANTPVALFVDEVQYLKLTDFSALIVALHRIGQKGLPLVLFGAGLPQLAALSGEIKSYAERLFEFPSIGPLDVSASILAIRDPVLEAGAMIVEEAAELIYRQTKGYPYFLQEWGSHAWNSAMQSPIDVIAVERAAERTRKALDSSFFRVRFDRLTPRERIYVRAMAEIGSGPHRSGDVAKQLGTAVTTAGPIRTGLIRKGMIWSPEYGKTAFTVPMFDDFLRRTIPR
jgi:AAA ATPase domain